MAQPAEHAARCVPPVTWPVPPPLARYLRVLHWAQHPLPQLPVADLPAPLRELLFSPGQEAALLTPLQRDQLRDPCPPA